jgi:hypothetical protein
VNDFVKLDKVKKEKEEDIKRAKREVYKGMEVSDLSDYETETD